MVSISMVTYRTPLAELDTWLASIDSPVVKRVYVVDNGRDPAVAEWCRVHRLRYLPGPNVGYGAGHNRALRRELYREDCPYHLVMNSDLSFDPSALERIAGYMDAHPDVGTLQPCVMYGGGELQYSCRRLPTPGDLFIRRFLPSGWFSAARDNYLLKHLDHTHAWDIPCHQGSFMFIRKSALLDTGLFDERYFMYSEDIDLTRRIHRRYATVYWPEVKVTHFHRASSYHSLKMMVIHMYSSVKYFNRWGWWHDPERRHFNHAIAPYPAR